MSDKKHIVCPHCVAVNRIPATRLGDKPKCGKCKRSLFTAHPVELTDQTFSKFINNSDIRCKVICTKSTIHNYYL